MIERRSNGYKQIILALLWLNYLWSIEFWIKLFDTKMIEIAITFSWNAIHREQNACGCSGVFEIEFFSKWKNKNTNFLHTTKNNKIMLKPIADHNSRNHCNFLCLFLFVSLIYDWTIANFLYDCLSIRRCTLHVECKFIYMSNCGRRSIYAHCWRPIENSRLSRTLAQRKATASKKFASNQPNIEYYSLQTLRRNANIIFQMNIEQTVLYFCVLFSVRYHCIFM